MTPPVPGAGPTMPPDDFASLFEQLPIGAYRSTPDGRQLRANPALVRLNGYADEAELLAAVGDIGREWYVQPGRRDEFQRRMQRDGQVADFVSEVFRHKTRERIWVREHAHRVCDAHGTVCCYEGTVEDITPQHRAEEALAASERRFRAYVEKSPVLTVVCDVQGRIGYASPAALTLLGVAPEAMCGTLAFDWLHPDDVIALQREFERVIERNNSGEESTCRVRCADGSYRYLALLGNQCLDDPAVAGLVLNGHDVSGRVLAEAALRRLNVELEERVRRRTGELLQARDAAEFASRRQAQMLRSAADGLQMPLQTLLAAVAPLPGLCAAQAGAEAIEAARKALRAAEGLGRGIADLSMLARLESGAALGDTPVPAEGAAPSAAPAAQPAGAAPQPRAARLLYIEDNAINLMLMQAMIDTQPQWQLQCAAQPEAGLEIARRERPDLILLDIRLPGIDGYEVLRRLRDDARTAAIPVVAVSADAMPADVRRGLQAGFADYLTKPVELQRLIAALQRLLPS